MTSTPLKVWWHELNTWEPEKARHFYNETLGWDFQPTTLPDGTRYWVAHKEGRAVGGSAVLRIREVSGDRLELIGLRERHAATLSELSGLKALLEASPTPL